MGVRHLRGSHVAHLGWRLLCASTSELQRYLSTLREAMQTYRVKPERRAAISHESEWAREISHPAPHPTMRQERV